MQKLPHTHSCFVCGEDNPIGLRLIMETEGQGARVEFTPGDHHVGFRNTIHGGITATLLDELMVWACAVDTGLFSYCAELNVRFQHPARPNEPTVATAKLTANRRNKILLAESELRSGDQLIASATGKYIPLPPSEQEGMAEDFVGNPQAFFDELRKKLSS